MPSKTRPAVFACGVFAVGHLIGSAGCGPAVPEDFTVSGRPVGHWVSLLKTGDVAGRREAVRKLGNVGAAAPETIPALASALSDRDPGIRSEAALALLKNGASAAAALPALRKVAAEDPDATVRIHAAQAAERIDGD